MSKSPTSRYYQAIVDCPLNVFIQVSVTGKLGWLVIEGECSEQELSEAWQQIAEEYNIAIGDNESRLMTNLYKEVVRLETTMSQVEMLVRNLTQRFVGRFVTELNKLLNTNFVFDVKKPDEYNNTLQRCLNRSKGFKIERDLKLMQMAALKKKQEVKGDSAATREAFYDVLIILSDAAHYPINDSITVYEYCRRIKRMNDYIEKRK